MMVMAGGGRNRSEGYGGEGKDDIRSVSVKVRNKLHRQMVASGIMWMSQAHSKDDTKTLYSKI